MRFLKLGFALTVACCVCGATAATRTWTGDGGDGRLSTPANWAEGIAPAATNVDAVSFASATATTVENDIDDLVLTSLNFPAGAGDYTLGGKPFNVGGVSFDANAGATQTFNADWRAAKKFAVFTVPADHTVIFNGEIGHAFPSNCAFEIKGAGTKVIHGGINVPVCKDTDNDANKNASRLTGGTFLIDGDVLLPRFIISDSSHVILTNGATFKLSNTGKNAFIQTCTIDLHGSHFLSEGMLIFAQDSNSHPHLRVFAGGLFDTGTQSFRCANNGVAEISVFEGGTFRWHVGSFSENGQTIFNLEGGRLIRNESGAQGFGIGQTPAYDGSYKAKGGNILNLNGGELWAAQLNNNSILAWNKDTHTVVNFNGATLVCGANVDDYWVGEVDYVDGNVLAGGIRVNTRGFNVGWSLGCVNAVEDGVDGGFTKLGPGTLTIKAAQGFSGPVSVAAGVLAVPDPSYVTQRVVLSPGATFAPGGAASLAGLTADNGVLRLVAGSPMAIATTPEITGTLFVELVDAAGSAVTEVGTYDVLESEGLDAALADRCRILNGATDRVYAFAVKDGRLLVTLAEGTNPEPSATASTWASATGGVWGEAANWSAGVPNGLGAVATLADALAAAGTVSLDADVTLGGLVFSGASAYTLAGDGMLTFAATNGAPTIQVDGGNHIISAPVVSTAPIRISTRNGGTVEFTGDVSGVSDIQIASGSVTVSDVAQLAQMTFTGGSVQYDGDAATVTDSLLLLGNGGVTQLPGAGDLTFTAAPTMMQASTLTLTGNGTSTIAFSGDGWMKAPSGNQRLTLAGGIYHFMADLRLLWGTEGENTGWFRLTPTSSHLPTSAVIDDGVQMRVYDAWFGAAENIVESPVTVTQNGGSLEMSGNICLNHDAQTNATTFVKTAGETGRGWLNFMHGPTTFRQTGGASAFSDLSFGYRLTSGTDYTKWEMGGHGLLDIAGGDFSVAGNWSWVSDKGTRRQDRVRLAGGTLTLPTTTRVKAYDRRSPYNYSTLELAGGTLALGGFGGSGALDDYLAGLNYLNLAGAVAVDTAGQEATITQPLQVTAEGTSLTKTGAGALTLVATNDVPNAVQVDAGTLSAAFRTDASAKRPDGLLALWTFDGEDPYRDVTGHGYDLVQAVDGTDVDFTTDLAHGGKCAWWKTAGGALKCTNVTSMGLLEMTVSLWVRLETKNAVDSHIGMFSTRVKADCLSNVVDFDIAYKGTINGNNPELSTKGIGNCFFGSNLTGIPDRSGGDISLQEWHMITITRNQNHVRSYIDGVLCRDVMESGKGATSLLRSGCIITLGANIANGTGLHEKMNVNGRLDDVSIYSRCLSGDEVAALYAARQTEPVAASVTVAADACLDLRDTALTAQTLGGAGVVQSGTVTALARLAVDPDAPLTVDALVLGEAGVLDCGRTADDPLPTSGTRVVVYAGEVTGGSPSQWTVTGTGLAAGRAVHCLALDADGNLVLESSPGGTVLLFR